MTAKKLFDEAGERGVTMLVLYADAAYDCSKLIFWGKLTKLDVDATGTIYTVTNHRDGIEIRRPAAADELLEYALRSPSRRLIFFCSCKLPGSCHRRTVAGLVKRCAERRGIDVDVAEWPGGTPAEIGLTVRAVVLHAVARRAATTIDVPAALGVGVAAALPWGTRAVLTAGGETLSVLVGPAGFSARGGPVCQSGT